MLPWLTAWARLIVADAVAADVANQAIARAASHRKRLRGPDLKIAARREAARLLASGAAAVPRQDAAQPHGGPVASPGGTAVGTAPYSAGAYAPRENGTAAPPRPGDNTDPRHPTQRDPREHTVTGRLEIALEELAPYQRLACVSYFLDGVNTAAIASLLGVSQDRAILILEGATPTIAHAVGDLEIPNFSAATDEVEVVTL